ncbi:nucleotide exchange factor GrpE [Candidatus Poribacteria bacterium]|nr:nucleotide exchange factor GrpE [Candidatus Poribacteria bacterium]
MQQEEQDSGGESRLEPEATPDAATQDAPPPDTAADFRERWLRAAAEMENMRKRLRRETEAARQREREAILRDFLAIADNLDRALGVQGAEGNQWIEGIEAIRVQFDEVLRRFGVTAFHAVGELFDANRHDAVAAVDFPDAEEGRIVEVIEPGYQFEDGGVLRHAKVVVVRHG